MWVDFRGRFLADADDGNARKRTRKIANIDVFLTAMIPLIACRWAEASHLYPRRQLERTHGGQCIWTNLFREVGTIDGNQCTLRRHKT